MLAVNLNVNVAFVNSTGSTTTRNGHDDLDCRTTATDRQQIANSTECTPCVLSRSRRRRDGREQGPIGDYATAPGCFVSSATNHAASPGRADPHRVASTAGAQCCFVQPAAEGLCIADRDPAECGGGDGGGWRRRQLPRGAAADCGGRIRTARSAARRLPHQADCDDASRRGRRDRWAGTREVGADCASDWTRWSTAPNRGFPRRGTVHH